MFSRLAETQTAEQKDRFFSFGSSQVFLMAVKHSFTDPKADGGDSTIVRPSDWNANHVVDEFVSSAITYYVCPSGQTTAVYNGASGVSVTPSDSNDGLTPTTPFATIQKARDTIAGKILFAPVTIQLADTDATKAYFPDGVLFDNFAMGGVVNIFDIALGGESDKYPTSYVYIKGNLTTPNNVAVVGATTYNGTTPSKRHAFICEKSNLRVAGMQFKYFAQDCIAANNHALVIVEKCNGTQLSTYSGQDQDGLIHVSDQSVVRFGDAITVAEMPLVNADGCSTVCFHTPSGYINLTHSSSGTNCQFAILADEKSHIFVEGITASFSGTSSHNIWGCLVGSTLNWNSDVNTSITVNCPNAAWIKARQGARVFETSGASGQSITFTAINRRAWVEEDSIVFLGPETNMGTSGNLIRPGCMVVHDIGFPYKNFYLGSLTSQDRQLVQSYETYGNQAYYAPNISYKHARGSESSPSALNSGDVMGYFNGVGYDGGTFRGAVMVRFEADGNFSSNVFPGKFVVATADGAGSEPDRFSINSSGLADFKYGISLSGDISPSNITSDQNDYNPTNLALAAVLRMTGDSSFRSITGLAGGADGRLLTLINVGSNTLLLKDQSTSSSAANRFDFGGYDIPFFPSATITLYYDSTSSRWRCQNHLSLTVPPARWGSYYYNEMYGTVSDSWMSSQVSGTGAANSATATVNVASHPGIVQHQLGTVATNRAAFATTQTANILLGNSNYYRFESMIRVPQLSNGTDTYTARFGFIDSVSAEPTDGVFFRYTHGTNSGNWVLVARSNNTETVNNTSSAVASATWYRLTIIVNPAGTVAEFFVNGTSLGTVTSNIPTGAGRGTGYGNAIIRSAGTATANVAETDNIEVISYLNTAS